ncbi:MAG: hypothetical protein IT167_20285 [Bryobacterales bacterium]|nr:hypothetical protein [Bryobacterales bacterium]
MKLAFTNRAKHVALWTALSVCAAARPSGPDLDPLRPPLTSAAEHAIRTPAAVPAFICVRELSKFDASAASQSKFSRVHRAAPAPHPGLGNPALLVLDFKTREQAGCAFTEFGRSPPPARV